MTKLTNSDTKYLETKITAVFGSPTIPAFADTLLDNLQKLQTMESISLSEIKHHQYQEVYVFEKDSEVSQISFYYDSSGVLKRIIKKEDNELATFLMEQFKELKVFCGHSEKTDSEFIFEESFHENLYSEIKGAVSEYEIFITDIKSMQYRQRYTFEKGGHFAIFDFSYNSKDQFTTQQAQCSLSSSKEFILEIESILEKTFGNK